MNDGRRIRLQTAGREVKAPSTKQDENTEPGECQVLKYKAYLFPRFSQPFSHICNNIELIRCFIELGVFGARIQDQMGNKSLEAV